MTDDPIIEELHRVRAEIAAQFNYDVFAIGAMLQAKQQEEDSPVISFSAGGEEAVPTPIQQDAQKLGGQPTIGAKRVPVETLLSYLAHGQTVAEFLADYDAVTEAEVVAVLAVMKQAVLDGKLTGMTPRGEEAEETLARSAVFETMRAEGLLLPKSQAQMEGQTPFEPIEVSGVPASEILLRERQ